jgi:hypothetical protein
MLSYLKTWKKATRWKAYHDMLELEEGSDPEELEAP